MPTKPIASLIRRLRGGPAGQVLRGPTRQSLSTARRRVQPAAVTITRLTVTAVVAFVLARLLIGVARPVLAPLTALLVVQVTFYRTFRSALERVASVVAGVMLALGFSRTLGFTWWSLGITIALALALGFALRLGDSILEVPISAMLILSLPVHAAVTERILDTLIGAVTGLASNLIVAPLRVRPAEEAVDDLGRRLAQLLDRMADDLVHGRGPQRAKAWFAQARSLTAELERVERALGQAEESVRLNPRGVLVVDPRIYLRRRLETLEHATLTIRGIARSLQDSAGLTNGVNPVRDERAAHRIADLLQDLAAALRAYGRLARSSVERDPLKADVDRYLAEAAEDQSVVTDVLRSEPSGTEPSGTASWSLRGELITHLDRLRTELHPAPPLPDRPGVPTPSRRWWRRPKELAARWRRRWRS